MTDLLTCRLCASAVLALPLALGCGNGTSEPDGASVDSRPAGDDAAPPDAARCGQTCATPIACPSPADGKVTVCGSVVDLGNGRFADALDAACTCSAGDIEPACTLSVKLYDERAILEDAVPVPLTAEDVVVDSCGRYRATNAAAPASGRVAVVTSSLPGESAWVTVAIADYLAENETLRLDARSLSRAMDEQWSSPASAQLGGATFSEAGVFVGVFRADSTPTSGVAVTVGGATQPESDYYFSDEDERLTTVDVARTTTGANGAGLVINQPLAQYSGVGAEPVGCSWESYVGLERPGWVLVRHISPSGCP